MSIEFGMKCYDFTISSPRFSMKGPELIGDLDARPKDGGGIRVIRVYFTILYVTPCNNVWFCPS